MYHREVLCTNSGNSELDTMRGTMRLTTQINIRYIRRTIII